ncbi:MAG: signal recognition particle-docking protein FtsY [Candidatus Aminicenantes bacterium]|nr:signal recognition particle-docking protein FtsY [Candidatus Aminicenantes bacterium]
MIGRLRDKLAKTREAFKGRLDEFLRSEKNREEILEDLTEVMILADVGVHSTEKIIESIRQRSKKSDPFSVIKNILKEEITSLLSQYSPDVHLDEPQSVLMMVGVNGGGKTTSLAKLAYHYTGMGKNTLLVAADTFRAAAQEQLSIWGKRLNIPVIKGQYGSDPASVVFDAIQSFKARRLQLLLIDTAGRIHTNVNLMNELEKIKRVISKEIEGAPHECLLVLDASIGQNALIQAKEFLKFSGLTGVFLTKLDGTAKGGSVISIVDELKLPIKFIGLGEEEQDLVPFSPSEFTNALLT